MEKSPYRLKVFEKIENFEKQGIFDQDVEDDQEADELLPNKIDYLHKKLSTKIFTAIALKKGGQFFEGQMKCGNLIIKNIIGTENLVDKNVGAIVTSNHFHPFDNYVILKALMPSLKKGRYFKVIKEGNYTNPPPGFGLFMKYGDTMPLSKNKQTMRKFIKAVSILLQDKNQKILFYPEQSMWWNYRKPRPFKPGAFKFAVDNNVPVQPIFVTMEDTSNLDGEGFPIQAYTVHILPPIYAKPEFNRMENIKYMCDENYRLWVETYEKFYNHPLIFLGNEKTE